MTSQQGHSQTQSTPEALELPVCSFFLLERKSKRKTRPHCPGAQAPAWVPLSLRASRFRPSEIDEVPFPMLVRIPHHHCEQSGALRICVPKLEFGNKEQISGVLFFLIRKKIEAKNSAPLSWCPSSCLGTPIPESFPLQTV